VTHRILIVDDEPVLRTLVARAFRQRGFEVVEAADGLAGLDVARSASVPFDLVVTNSRMPHLDGPHLAECLREIDPRLPIIHLSGSLGMNPVKDMPPDIPTLFKPFDIWKLVDQAEHLIRQRGVL
jgi:two-component system cell cycle sensor histidine kinase/response regulator CckA